VSLGGVSVEGGNYLSLSFSPRIKKLKKETPTKNGTKSQN